ncbi:hypothetical protein Tco_1033219 [Tanacetum coccineum]|uniref:Uncharacterized protein n=1 Tax=Tanacetum coccineum TaxID=301880 RepID=A0ABQ5GE22_9ASTR
MLIKRVTEISESLLKSFYISGLKPALQCVLLRSNPTTLDEAFSLARVAKARFTNQQLWEPLRSYPLTLGEAFFRARIIEARFGDENNQAIDTNIGDPDVKDKQEVKKADDQEIENIKDAEGKIVEDQQVSEADDDTNNDDFSFGANKVSNPNGVFNDVGGVGYSKADGKWEPARRIEDEVKGWLDEDLEYYHLKELHYSAQCHTQMSLWIISRGVVLLILLMEYKFNLVNIELTHKDHSNSRKNPRNSRVDEYNDNDAFREYATIIGENGVHLDLSGEADSETSPKRSL